MTGAWTEHESRPVSSLLVAGLQIEVEPDQIARLGDITQRNSSPTGDRSSASGWLSGVI